MAKKSARGTQPSVAVLEGRAPASLWPGLAVLAPPADVWAGHRPLGLREAAPNDHDRATGSQPAGAIVTVMASAKDVAGQPVLVRVPTPLAPAAALRIAMPVVVIHGADFATLGALGTATFTAAPTPFQPLGQSDPGNQAQASGAAPSATTLPPPTAFTPPVVFVGSGPTGGISAPGAPPPSGGGGGGPTLPTFTIVSPGKHPNDNNPVPDVVQGMPYVVQYTTTLGQDPNATYALNNIVFAYPNGAVKGYGQFQTINPGDTGGDPDGPYTKFLNGPDIAYDTTYTWDATFTADDLDVTTPTQANDHFIDRFFWGPEAVGNKTVSGTATFNKIVNGQVVGTVTASDSVALNVIEPTGSLKVVQLGLPGVSPVMGNGNQYIQIDLNRPHPYPDGTNQFTAPKPGIVWVGNVADPQKTDGTSFGGSFVVVQTIVATIKRSYVKAGATINQQMVVLSNLQNPGTCLDPTVGRLLPDFRQFGQVLNTANGPSTGTGYGAPVGKYFKGVDSPNLELPLTMDGGTPVSSSVDEQFVTTLMYEPPLGADQVDPILVPVRKATWLWTTDAVFQAGANPPWFTQVSPTGTFVSDLSASSNAGFPSWGHNIQEFAGLWTTTP